MESARVATSGGSRSDRFDVGRQAEELLTLPGLNCPTHEQSPSISGDGRYIAFVSERIQGEGERDIFLYDRRAARLLSLPDLNSKHKEMDPCVIVMRAPGSPR